MISHVRPFSDPRLSSGSGAAAQPPLSIVFVLRSVTGSIRLFDSVVRLLLERGHDLHLSLERSDEHGPVELAWLEELGAHNGFSYQVAGAIRGDRWYKPAKSVREALDYLRWIGPEFADMPYFQRRAEGRSPGFVRSVSRHRLLRTTPALRLLRAVIEAIDRAMPVGREVRSMLRARRPDVLLISPRLPPGSLESHYVTAAQRLGIRTVVAVASWDNLSSKQLLRVVPDALLVWNETQRAEAESIHGVPPDRVVVTGAQCFDQWFGWEARPREAFCRRVGLDPHRPFVLYAGGALLPGRRTEAEFVSEWIAGLHSSENPVLREIGVLVRPHPKRAAEWDNVVVAQRERVAVWPHGGVPMPIGEDARADYYDSLFHSAAVVGLNTTAMIEAAIVGREVYTVLVPDFHESQRGTFHFDYLFDVAGGAVSSARSLEEHYRQLAAAVARPDSHPQPGPRGFVEAFVRPHGIDRPATPLFAAAIERVGALGPAPGRREPAARLLVRAIVMVSMYAARPRELARGLMLRLGRLRAGRGHRASLAARIVRRRRT